jgi:sugar phosphate isomerase/epimerase
MDRRTFLGALPAAALVAGCGSPEPSVASAAASRAGGLQLYTLRAVIADNVDRTLAAVAAIGYQEVEFAGLYGLTPREMRAKLDAIGLRATSSHQQLAEVRRDWASVLDGARELGQSQVIVPSIPTDLQTPDGLREVADDFNRAAEAARAAGLRFGYHNHDWEHRAFPDGSFPIDLLLARTDPELVDWQMDVFWTVHGGADPMRYLNEVGGRIKSIHVKDRTADGTMVAVGDGVIDFASLVPFAEGLGLEHAFVENDRPGDDPMGNVRRSFEHLSALS